MGNEYKSGIMDENSNDRRILISAQEYNSTGLLGKLDIDNIMAFKC